MRNINLLIAFLIVAIGVVVGLGSLKIPTTPVDLDVSSQAVSFKIAGPSSLAPFLVNFFAVSGKGKADIGGEISSFSSTFSLSRPDKAAPMSLQSIPLQNDDGVRVRKKPGTKSSFELSLRSNEPKTLTIILGAGSLSTEADRVSKTSQSAAPQIVQITLSQDAALSFDLAEREWAERMPIEVSQVSFFDSSDVNGVPNPISTVDRGNIRFSGIEAEDGKSKEITLREGQPFSFTADKPGILRTLKLSSEGIALFFSGTVKELKTAWNDQAKISHMPSLLTHFTSQEWFKQALALVTAALGLLFGYLQVSGERKQP